MSGQVSSTSEIGSQKYAIDRYADKSAVRRPVVVIVHGVDGMGGESGSSERTVPRDFRATARSGADLPEAARCRRWLEL